MPGRTFVPIIDKLDPAARHYLQVWNAKAVCLSPTGKVFTSHNPGAAGATAAWWCRDVDAARVAKFAQRTGDVEAAAWRLGIRLTRHDSAVTKAQDRAAALSSAMRQAQEAGLMRAFNTEYRQRRLAAFERGKNYMPYAVARARLTQAVASAAAHSGALTSLLIEQVLAY
jgi:hypothetical protein